VGMRRVPKVDGQLQGDREATVCVCRRGQYCAISPLSIARALKRQSLGPRAHQEGTHIAVPLGAECQQHASTAALWSMATQKTTLATALPSQAAEPRPVGCGGLVGWACGGVCWLFREACVCVCAGGCGG
jgi:hypothetical protein